MNSREFVESIKTNVRDSAIDDTIKNLEDPPGRKPQQKLLDMSSWYKRLNQEDKNMMREVLRDAVDMAIFGHFCVLDGVRVIEDRSDKGKFKLYYSKNDEITLLNDENDEYLHDLYKEISSDI